MTIPRPAYYQRPLVPPAGARYAAHAQPAYVYPAGLTPMADTGGPPAPTPPGTPPATGTPGATGTDGGKGDGSTEMTGAQQADVAKMTAGLTALSAVISTAGNIVVAELNRASSVQIAQIQQTTTLGLAQIAANARAGLISPAQADTQTALIQGLQQELALVRQQALERENEAAGDYTPYYVGGGVLALGLVAAGIYAMSRKGPGGARHNPIDASFLGPFTNPVVRRGGRKVFISARDLAKARR